MARKNIKTSVYPMKKDNDYIRIPCKRCIEDIGKPPVFSELYVQAMRKRRGDFNFIQNRPRCLNCLKYLARDPSKVGEDEVAKLIECSGCEIAKYCSVSNCQEKHFLIHKWFCKQKCEFSKEELARKYDSLSLIFDKDCKVAPKMKMSEQEEQVVYLLHNYHHFVQGLLSMNGELLHHFQRNNFSPALLTNEFVEFRSGRLDLKRQLSVAYMYLGEWDSLWECVKSQLCKSSMNRKKNEAVETENISKCGTHDDIIVALKKDKLLNTCNFIEGDEEDQIFVGHLLDCLVMAAVVKINTIEDMKWQLKRHNEHLQKTRPRKKFFHHKRILNCITLYILGKDVKSFEIDLEEQETHLENIFQTMNDVFWDGQPLGLHSFLELIDDVKHNFSLKDKVWLDPRKPCKVLPFVLDSIFNWKFFFSMNTVVKEYIMDFMKKNKKFPKTFEKHFKMKLPEYIKMLNTKDYGERPTRLLFEEFASK